MPFEIDETVPLDILNDQFQKMAIEQDIELDSELESGKRKTTQGYDTEYVIYNGTTKTEKIGTEEVNYKVTKGSESKYIGEVWKAPEYNLLVVSMGIGIISSETINEDGSLDVLDIVVMVNIIIEVYVPTDDELLVADLNDDGFINILDIVILVNTILTY